LLQISKNQIKAKWPNLRRTWISPNRKRNLITLTTLRTHPQKRSNTTDQLFTLSQHRPSTIQQSSRILKDT
jgi:hypothetical protein